MNKFISFILGGVAGSLITWKLIEKKYNDLAEEEIESVKNNYKMKEENKETQKDDPDPKEDEDYVVKFDLNTLNDEIKNDPYVISPEDFENSDYHQRFFTYYSDDVLVDEDHAIVNDPTIIIGDALDHFGDYDDDSVHVRDDVIATDYEIIRSDYRYSDTVLNEYNNNEE